LLLLFEGSVRQAGAQVVLYPNQIKGTIEWNNPAGTVKGYLLAQGFGLYGTGGYVAAGEVNGPNRAEKYFLPDSHTSTLYDLTVNSSAAGIAYNVSPSMRMVNGDIYHFASAISDPVLYPGPPVTLNFSECAGLIHVHFRSPGGAPVSVDSSAIEARLNGTGQAGTIQAANGQADRTLIVRGGNTFDLKVSAVVHAGGDPFLDYVQLQPFNDYTVTVPCNGEVDVTLIIPP
jgi:hypothetical protein